VQDMLDSQNAITFSRIPVWGENEDDVEGYVLKDEVLLQAAKDRLDMPLSELKREMLVVPESMPVATLFERLLDQREHIALVADEYGGVAGVASMEDVVETLLGMEIVDEADTVHDMREMARKRWYQRARRLGVVPSDYPPPMASKEGKPGPER
ncbi:MAG: CBS domain-containing protein, partial [Polyangiales bacterium]